MRIENTIELFMDGTTLSVYVPYKKEFQSFVEFVKKYAYLHAEYFDCWVNGPVAPLIAEEWRIPKGRKVLTKLFRSKAGKELGNILRVVNK